MEPAIDDGVETLTLKFPRAGELVHHRGCRSPALSDYRPLLSRRCCGELYPGIRHLRFIYAALKHLRGALRIPLHGQEPFGNCALLDFRVTGRSRGRLVR